MNMEYVSVPSVLHLLDSSEIFSFAHAHVLLCFVRFIPKCSIWGMLK